MGHETCGTGVGLGDIYMVRRNAAFGWGEPLHLGCVENGTGPNSAAQEYSPSLVELKDGTYHLGANVNTAGSETRSTISWDHRRLYFGRDGEIQTASRSKKK